MNKLCTFYITLCKTYFTFSKVYIPLRKIKMFPFIILPRYFKLIGILLFVGGYIYAYLAQPDYSSIADGNSLAVQCMILFGLLFVTCSKEKVEDEMISQMRLTSLQYAVIIFVLLRLSYKLIGYLTKDESWMPTHQANFLLFLYILIFHFQTLIKPALAELFSKKGNNEK